MSQHLLRAGLDAALQQQVITIYATLFGAAVNGDARAGLDRARRGLVLALDVYATLRAVIDELAA